jgi:addiction module HigA family antidote
MAKLKNTHPGEVLLEEFLLPMETSAYRLSQDVGIPQTRTSQIIKGKRRITADTALRLSKYFGTTAKFWLGLQMITTWRRRKERLMEELKRIHLLDGT